MLCVAQLYCCASSCCCNLAEASAAVSHLLTCLPPLLPCIQRRGHVSSRQDGQPVPSGPLPTVEHHMEARLSRMHHVQVFLGRGVSLTELAVWLSRHLLLGLHVFCLLLQCLHFGAQHCIFPAKLSNDSCSFVCCWPKGCPGMCQLQPELRQLLLLLCHLLF
ncbi:hypothetical protein COO60DRAFT_393454 [Scenedesmus sp. NREL 46B-D3]|nr:hypothetical protein COO60DRAFT_393454 [Scenedesmus sp. NREL 46B-D3]